MALHFARDDQDTVNLVGKQFLEFYYDNLNKSLRFQQQAMKIIDRPLQSL